VDVPQQVFPPVGIALIPNGEPSKRGAKGGDSLIVSTGLLVARLVSGM
jgi:hypothetical protein